MKHVIVLLIVLTASVSSYAQQKDTTAKNESDSIVIYTCGMHPDVKANKPGRCPNCGMGLIAKKIKVDVKKTYTCTMHPEVISDKPGKCSKCGMDLVVKKITDNKTPM